jgi:hypothetical protein
MAFCGKSEIMEHVLKMQQISLLPIYIKQIFWEYFLCAFAYKNAGCLRLKFLGIKSYNSSVA